MPTAGGATLPIQTKAQHDKTLRGACASLAANAELSPWKASAAGDSGLTGVG